jgi:hypothetical protein
LFDHEKVINNYKNKEESKTSINYIVFEDINLSKSEILEKIKENKFLKNDIKGKMEKIEDLNKYLKNKEIQLNNIELKHKKLKDK